MTRQQRIIITALYVMVPVFICWLGYRVYSYDLPRNFFAGFHNGVPTVFYNLPQMSVGGVSANGHTSVLKIRLSIEVPIKDYRRVEDFEPRMVEKILLFMRQKNPDELRQADGEERLRESLLQEIGNGAFPIPVMGISISEMVVE